MITVCRRGRWLALSCNWINHISKCFLFSLSTYQSFFFLFILLPLRWTQHDFQRFLVCFGFCFPAQVVFRHCCFIYGHLPPKMPLFASGSDTDQKIYWLIWGLPGPRWGEKMYTVSIFTLKGSICGPNHMWKPPEVILKQLWELLCRVLHVGHQSRMSCSDYILPHRTKCVQTSNFLYCIWVSLKTQADTWILGVFNVFNLSAFF